MMENQTAMWKKQTEAQAETNRITEKVTSASTEHRQKIRTEQPKIRAKDAIALFFEIMELEDSMDEFKSTNGMTTTSLVECVHGLVGGGAGAGECGVE